MTTSETVSQNTGPDQEPNPDSLVYFQARIPESAQRHFRIEAAKAGLNNSELFMKLLTDYTGYVPPNTPTTTKDDQD